MHTLTDTQEAAVNAVSYATAIHCSEHQFNTQYAANLHSEDVGGIINYYSAPAQLKAFYDYEFNVGHVFETAIV